MMDAMDAGADDFEADGDVFTIYTLPDDFNTVAEAMNKYTFASAQIEMVPQNYQKLENEEHIKLMEKMIEIMEDDDDVQNVWHNWDQE
jgi:transcriptional/translational regulatory protein YebC/TACO1